MVVLTGLQAVLGLGCLAGGGSMIVAREHIVARQTRTQVSAMGYAVTGTVLALAGLILLVLAIA